ncbi:MAG: glycosyltransferase family 2 protein [Propionibacteriaceae bacterium]|nr:glycosyltransferase family 2 protein [Propionibacteriaceae bacterium]
MKLVLLLVIDNGSVDGTYEILRRYAKTGRVELHQYPVYDKKQYALVTEMARRAASKHWADWVLNADADEFFLPVDRTLALREALEHIPATLGAVTVPVINMTGRPAPTGSGLGRLVWRDERPEDTLLHDAGLPAHPTFDAIHVGDPAVLVRQGNHFVSIPSQGEPDARWAIEVLHYPWRSWTQFRGKVDKSGQAYANNPTHTPSPRHHGLRDYRFLGAGALERSYLYRHPRPGGLEVAPPGLVRDTWLDESQRCLLTSGRALLPAELAKGLDDEGDGAYYTTADWDDAATIMRVAIALDQERTTTLSALHESALQARARLIAEFAEQSRQFTEQEQTLAEYRHAHDSITRSVSFKVGRMITGVPRWARDRLGKIGDTG